jgi:SAM-dependent methyltransferase
MSTEPENQACVLCGEGKVEKTATTHQDSGTVYSLFHCKACGGEFWTPFKNPGASWYEHDERYSDRNQDPILTPNKKHTGVIDFLKDTPGTVLDVGCGVGNFLAYAKIHGWTTCGIDFDADAIAAAKKTFGLSDVTVEDVSSFKERVQPRRFNLVTFFDVFEHLDNHQEFIEDVKSLLVEKGTIALSVPYRRAWRWLIPADLPPRHLTRWDEPSLRFFLERHGFKVQRVTKLPATFYYLVMKFRFKYGNKLSFNVVGKLKQYEDNNSVRTTKVRKGTMTPRVWLVHKLAQVKDIVVFGIPAGIVWCVLFFTDAKHTDLCVIATRT